MPVVTLGPCKAKSEVADKIYIGEGRMQIHLRTHNLGARCRAGINPEHPLLRKH